MSELIFHHYPNSPFSEKVRLIFGFKQLSWRSVTIPVIMPKPDLVALTGGYRRTPVLQIGADIYCDTALIADVLERIKPAPTLYPVAQDGLARTIAQWADSSLFWSAIGYAFQPAGMAAMFGHLPPQALQAFAADRAALRGDAARLAVPEATAQLNEFIRRIDNMLAGGHAFLLGAEATIADFSVYHGLWYVRRVSAVAGIFDAVPRLMHWMDRMAAFGHDQPAAMTGEEALAVACASTPVAGIDAGAHADFLDLHGAAFGDVVTVMPGDYGLDPVEGRLVVSTASEFAIEREDARAGTVVVHFPRLGFQLKKSGDAA
ncbi:MAG: glutathione S-transferase family protein [Herminiimonas sp.]|nr:glutathione S-transferase family protein [Herminiimonas sp.]